MLERLAEHKVPLSSVLEQGWDTLANTEWRLIDYICSLLKPFAVYTQLVSVEETTTISSALPVLMELNLHLDEMKKISELDVVSSSLQSDLKR